MARLGNFLSASCRWLAAVGIAALTLSMPAQATTAVNAKKPGTAAQQVKARKAAATPSYAGRADAMLLADEIAEQQGLDRAQVYQAISAARQLPVVARLILPAAATAAKNWQLYRSRFIEPVRIKAGVAFWTANKAWLERVEKDFGVPPEIVVGVIGVETIYGRQLGNFRVLDALATLSLDFPTEHPRAAERRAFFRSELGYFLHLKRHAGINPLAWRGSYAGAMGMPQFMPSSWLRFAIDFDGDGRIDLFHSTADVIGSVANYLKAFNWQPGMPTHYAVRFDSNRLDLEALLLPDILPTFDASGFSSRGALLDEAGRNHNGRLALVELQNGTAEPQYVAGTENFYVITRYNRSSYYAMAVIELGQEAAAAMRREASAGNTKR